jgi:hypothetical protein
MWGLLSLATIARAAAHAKLTTLTPLGSSVMKSASRIVRYESES